MTDQITVSSTFIPSDPTSGIPDRVQLVCREDGRLVGSVTFSLSGCDEHTMVIFESPHVATSGDFS